MLVFRYRAFMWTLAGGLILMATSSRQGRAGTHTETISQAPTTYTVSIPRETAVKNVSLTIVNTGTVPVGNPRLTVNGRYDWFDKESIVQEALGSAETEEEKALALWEFARSQHQRMTPPGDRFISDPVVMFNVYGYGNCGCISPALATLAEAAGFKARVWELRGHTVSEMFFGGAWHMMDADTGRMFRDPEDNHILSVREIQDRGLWRVFKKDRRGFEEHGYDRWRLSNHTMAITLRPGEKLVRPWRPSGKFYNYWAHAHYKPSSAWWLPPTHYASGEIVFRPKFSAEALERDAVEHEFLVPRSRGQDGPALRGEPPLPGVEKTRRRGYLIYHVQSPYVIVGGRFECTFFRGRHSGRDWITAAIKNAWTTGREDTEDGRVRVYGAAWTSDVGELPTVVDFGHLFHTAERNREGIYEYDIRFEFAASDPAEHPVGMSDLILTTEIQVAPLSIPALSPGKNTIRYRDETEGERKLRITHSWEDAREPQ